MVRNFVVHILLLAIYHRTAYCRTEHQEIREKNYHQLCPNHLVLLAIGIHFHVLTHRIRIPGWGPRLFRVFLAELVYWRDWLVLPVNCFVSKMLSTNV